MKHPVRFPFFRHPFLSLFGSAVILYLAAGEVSLGQPPDKNDKIPVGKDGKPPPDKNGKPAPGKDDKLPDGKDDKSNLELLLKDLKAQDKRELLERATQKVGNSALPAVDRVRTIPAIEAVLETDRTLAGTPAAQAAVAAIVAFLDELVSRGVDAPGTIEMLTRINTALGTIRSPDAAPAIPGLIRLLTNDVGPGPCEAPHGRCGDGPYLGNRYILGQKYREAAAVALGQIGSPQAIPALTQVLLRDRYPHATPYQEVLYLRLNAPVRAAAATALGQIGNERSIPDLAIAAQSDVSPVVRTAAVQAIQAIRKGGGVKVVP